MKFGLLAAICEGMTFADVVKFACENNLKCLEVACWPAEGAKRRYAGVNHIDAANLTPEKAKGILKLCAKHKVEISSLAYYPNTMDPDLDKRSYYVNHLHTLIDASAVLGVNMVSIFIGRMPKAAKSNQ